MRRSDRLARLHELLARVQRNTAERRREIAIISAQRGVEVELTAGEQPSTPPPASVMRAYLEPIPPPPASPADLGSPDDWSSLLTRELSDPNPFGESMEETSFPSLVPPDPPPPSDSEALLRASLPVAEPPMEAAPESQFEHAIRIATEQRPEPPDPRALWLEAAGELRERRTTLPPEDDPVAEVEPEPPAVTPTPASTTPIPSSRRSWRPVATEPHGDTPTPIATFETTHAPRAADSGPGRIGKRDSVAPAPLSRRRRALRPSPAPLVMGEPPVERPTPYWAVVLLGCGVGLLFTLAYIAFRAVDQRGAVAQAVPNATLSATSTAAASSPRAPVPPVGVPVEIANSATATATGSPVDAPAESSPSVASDPPLPVIKRPKDMGLLWVDAPSPVTVYVQGLPAGANGLYLEVPCGLKNVRLARRDLPPPGHSFPMWLGKAESVLVPCGAANRVKMSSE